MTSLVELAQEMATNLYGSQHVKPCYRWDSHAGVWVLTTPGFAGWPRWLFPDAWEPDLLYLRTRDMRVLLDSAVRHA